MHCLDCCSYVLSDCLFGTRTTKYSNNYFIIFTAFLPFILSNITIFSCPLVLCFPHYFPHYPLVSPAVIRTMIMSISLFALSALSVFSSAAIFLHC